MQQDDAACVPQAIAKGDRIMLRKLLLPMLTTVVLAGCATDYQYRSGNGDYYYGQPRVEYRYSGPGGFYGDMGFGYGYGASSFYFYDGFGRFVPGYPSRHYGFPYYGGNRWYPSRIHRGRTTGEDVDNGNDRLPPWRDLGQLQSREPVEDGYRNPEIRERDSLERQIRRPRLEPGRDTPMRMQGLPAAAPAMRERSEPASRMGGSNGGATRSRNNRETRIEE